MPFGPSSQPAAAPVPPFASARDSAPATEGGITLEMHAHFEVGSISGVGDVPGEMSKIIHTEMVPVFRATVKDMIRSGQVQREMHARRHTYS